LPWSRSDLINGVESLGFRFVELTMRPEINLSTESNIGLERPPKIKVLLKEVSKSRVDAVAERAASLFSLTRWHRDPNLGPELAARRLARWVCDSVNHESKVLIEALDAGSMQPLGFFLIRRDESGASFWELTAIYREFQGRGLALPVWQEFLRFELDCGTSYVSTNFNAVNLGLYSLYRDAGFSLGEPSVALHQVLAKPKYGDEGSAPS